MIFFGQEQSHGRAPQKFDKKNQPPALTGIFSKIFFTTVLSLTISESAYAQVINGDFENRSPTTASGDCVTGDAQARFAPAPWKISGTPDYQTERQISFTTEYHERTSLAGFDPSPAGGCFEGFRNTEGLTQDILIADASEPLKGTYFYTEYTRPGRTQCTPNIEFRVNSTNSTSGTSVSTAPNVGSANGPTSAGSWVSIDTLAFTPSDYGVADGGTLSFYFGSASSCSETWGFVDSFELIPDTIVIEASDNDYTTLIIDPAAGGTTASVFSNDERNGSPITSTDVTATITDNGRLYGATINPDGTLNVPAGTAPGIYQIEYQICDTTDPTICDTAIATIAVQSATPDVISNPLTCGGWNALGWSTFGPKINDINVVFNSGEYKNDPYLYEPISRDADGRIISYMGIPEETIAGNIPDKSGTNLIKTTQNDPAHKSEYHRFVHRFHGEPGTSETITYDTVSAAEYTAYWIEDAAGNVLDSQDFSYTRALNGPGESLSITLNYPADGVVFLQSAIFDPTAGYGSPVIADYECPLPELTMTKVADSTTNVAPGETVTYTYTVENTGNENIDDVTVSDVHNGSGALSPITIDTLTNTSGSSSDDGADNLVDVLAPGDIASFISTYIVTATDLLSGGPLTNTATGTGDPAAGDLTDPTATESITLSGTQRPALLPNQCGAVEAEGFLVNPGAPGTERLADWNSGATGSNPYDPYTFIPEIARDASTGVVSFYQTSTDGTVSSPLPSNGLTIPFASHLSSTLASATPNISEIWRIAARLEGVPGTTETLTIQNGGAHEHSAYWQTNVSGSIINTNSSVHPGHDDGWLFGVATTTEGGDGTSYTIDVTYPSDGIVILNFAVLDATGGFGPPQLNNYECPAPSLTIAKAADDNTDRKIGETITYTYTAENTGNVSISNVTVTDQHTSAAGTSALTVSGEAGDTGNSAASTDAASNGSWDTLAPDDAVTFTSTYIVTEADIIAGKDIENTATVTGAPAAGTFPAGPITATEEVTVAKSSADLVITKTNTPGVNAEADQASDTLTSGASTTYTLTVTNNGPDSVTGAVITDVVGAGLTCTATDAVTLSGDGVPTGSFTIGDLTGAGITLETLADTEAATLVYSCKVN